MMSDPSEHAAKRNTFEEFLRRLPGFRGYLEKEYRRDSDRMVRDHLVDRLQRSKQRLDHVARTLTNAGRLEQLTEIDRLRGRIDRLIGRIRGAMQGYSGFFDFVQVDEDRLQEVYFHDLDMVEQVEAFEQAVSRLPDRPDELAGPLAERFVEADKLDEHWSRRDDLLKGWDNPWGPLRG